MHIPVLVGGDADEATVFAPGPATTSDYWRYLRADTGASAEEEFRLWPASRTPRFQGSISSSKMRRSRTGPGPWRAPCPAPVSRSISISSPGPTPADEPGSAHVMAKSLTSSVTAIRTTGCLSPGKRPSGRSSGDTGPTLRAPVSREPRGSLHGPLTIPVRTNCWSSGATSSRGPPGQVSLRSRNSCSRS